MARPKLASVSLTFVDELIDHHLDLVQQIEQLQAELASNDRKLRNALEVSPEKTFATSSGTAVLVESDVVTYDHATLVPLVPAEVLSKVTEQHVDREKIEAAAELGLVTRDALDRARQVIKRKQQLRVRRT